MNNLLNIKSFLKFLSKNKLYTAIDVIGLSISLMFVILIAIYTVQEIGVDRFQQKADRVYALGSERNLGSAYRLADHLLNRYPEIEKVCPLVPPYSNWSVTAANQRTNADLVFADSTFFDFFSFELISGDVRQALATREYAVISKSFARRAFPDRDPLGQRIEVNDSVTVTVNAIMRDIRKSTIPYCDILLRIDNIKYFNSSMDSPAFNNAGSCNIFLLAKEGADLPARADDIAQFFKEDLKFWIYARGISEKVILTPLNEIYFSKLNSSTSLNKGDWRFVMILMSVGILILLFAVINYINLTVAQTGFRAKEMATRRLLGSSRGELFARLIMESTLITLLSYLIGLILAAAITPIANDLLQTKLHISDVFTPLGLLTSLLLVVALGGLAGLLPAIIISNSKPIDVVRGGFRRRTKMVFSKVFITFQNVITIMMIAASIVMVVQINYMIKAPLGYNTTNLMKIESFQFDTKDRFITFGNEISGLASVSRIAYGQGTPFDRGNNWTTTLEDRNISFQILTGDSTYFDMLGFQILKDNQTTSPDSYFLTEQALRETGLEMDATEFPLGGNKFPIAGVLRDFQLYNITYDLQPTLVRVGKLQDFYPWSMVVEVQGDPWKAHSQIKEIYERMTELEFGGQFIDDQIQDSFESQQRTSHIVMIFCVIAIIISLLGLLAMSTYFIQQRSREMSVRKVFGSSNSEVLWTLVRTFLNYVVVAFVIATPLIYYIMRRWLSDYSYRMVLSPWIFVAAGLFCLLVSFLTVFWQSKAAAEANPVDSIKAE